MKREQSFPSDTSSDQEYGLDPYGGYDSMSPKVISGDGSDITLFNIKTDFRTMNDAHKKSFVPKVKIKSAYNELIPDVSGIPEPDQLRFDDQEREQVIQDGNIPEVRPFMAGAKMVLAERRARKQHRKAQSASRRVHVAHNIANGVVNDTGHSAPENKFRPRTLREKAIAKRMGRLIRRANASNSSANILEEMFTEPETVSTRLSREQTSDRLGFDKNRKNLSVFEKGHRRSSRKLYEVRREQADRVTHGYRVPVVRARIGKFSFENLAKGGPGNPIKKASKTIERRDKAVLKAEALRRQKAANKVARLALQGEVKDQFKVGWTDLKSGIKTVTGKLRRK